ncbi:CHAP domain-containing protein [Anaerovoracaceae bacterium 41-7]|uniref:CHAP domain-containing protein n=1 Tax=Anaerotruncus colihominis TaxID=169435 RepID=A0A845QIV7_9FIRM|nr:CHAP domain-containing protein [Emergencia sp.]NBH60915.1 CHAP domain-containing protein [Anaerotruncus colihominis]NCF01570.1 CHAP domain-containing protein [Anaerotruncus sp. 80]
MNVKIKEVELKTSEMRKDRFQIKMRRQLVRYAWIKGGRAAKEYGKLQSREASSQRQDNPAAYAQEHIADASGRIVRQGRSLFVEQRRKQKIKMKYMGQNTQVLHGRSEEHRQRAGLQGAENTEMEERAGGFTSALSQPSRRFIASRKRARKQFERRRMIQIMIRKRRSSSSTKVYSSYRGSGGNKAVLSFFQELPVFQNMNVATSLQRTMRRGKFYRRVKIPMLSSSMFVAIILVVVILFAASMALYGDDESDDIPENGTIVEIAESQLGNVGGMKYWSWYGFETHVDWCACFVSWCADKAGYIEKGDAPKFSYCQDGVNWFISKKQWYSGKIEPKAGMIIFFDWNGNGVADHVGIVKGCKNDIVTTIEGNSGDQCKERQYAVGNGWIMGYGRISKL